MSGWTNGHPLGDDLARRVRHMQEQRSWRRRLRRWGTALCLAIMLVVGVNGLVPAGVGIVFAAPPAPPKPPAVQGSPNRADPHAHASSATRPNGSSGSTAGAAATAGVAQPPSHIRRTLPALMQPGALPLKAGAAAAFKGSDGVLEVQVPANAVTAADVAAAGGGLSLSITQIAPASGSSAGGSGLVSFGTYLIQVVDAHGVLATHGLHAPLTLKLHPFGAKRNSALDLSKAFVVLNGSLPEGTQLAPVAPATPAAVGPGHTIPGVTAPSVGVAPVAPAVTDRAAIGLGALASQPVTFDATTNTLIAPLTVGTPSTSLSWNTHTPVASFGNPDPFNVDLNAGGLTASIPIDVPAGPGGTTPPISLSYGSAGVAEQHAPQGAAGWTGEGWNMGLGAITWAEHNVLSNCSPNCTCGGGAPCSPNWQSVWQISDPFGTGSELIAPDITYSTYYDDTPNNYCTTVVSGSCTAYANWPVQWHTADENYVKIISYVGPLTLKNMAPKPPCFRVWLRNGVMEEFGCTSDSLQYYFEPANGYHITGWMLDLITDPEGNQIHLVYQATTGTKIDTDVNHTSYPYTRDVVLQRIEYDSPGCRNAQTMCTGTGWTPLAQVVFNAAHAPTSFYPGPAPTGCNTGANMRCDDPLDLSGQTPIGLAAPDVQSLYVLNSVQVQTRSSGTGAWNTLKTYQLSYDQSGPTTTVDPATGKNESTAGKLLLTKIVELGDDGATAMPTRTFSYTAVTEYYEDDVYHPNPAGNCGPAFNVRTGCLLWSQSYAGNSYYLSSADNGMGLHQTFSWANARNNTHGVNGGGTNNADPLYCNGLSAAAQATYPCDETDDQNWSRVVLTDQHEQHYRAASTGNVLVDSHTGYAYQLSYPLAAQECADCVAGFNWGNQNDGDYLDYYHGKFMGFAQATVNQPDGGQEVHKYYATMGYGLYNLAKVTCFSASPCHAAPWWDIRNAGHGHETEVDVYDAPPNATRLLRQTLTQYTLTCPPPGVTATPAYTAWGDWDLHRVSMLDHNNPVAVCRVLPSQVDSYVLDGAAQASSPHTTTTYAYDSLNRVTDETVNSNGGGSATGSPTVLVTHTDYIQNDAITTSLTSASGRYLIDFPAQVYTRDSGNTVHYSCSQTSYDGAAYATGQQSTLTLGHATTSDTYTGCGTSPSFTLSGQLRTTTGYDPWGNVVAAKDADANAGVSGHAGCTYNSAQYTACDAFDSTYETLSTSSTNALNQTSTTGYTSSAAGGFGRWPTSTTDFNGQTTTYAYDALGRMTGLTLPGETVGLTTANWTYTAWCGTSGPQPPCIEIDEVKRLDSSTTVTKRAFYDGLGRLVETRDAGPGGNDVVRYAYYDESGRQWFQSTAYFVPAYTGAPGATAFATPDASQAGTTTSFDVLSRAISVTDPLSQITKTSYGAACSVVPGDTACYAQTAGVDALGHQHAIFNDAFGRQTYSQSFTGNSTATYAVYATTRYKYDANTNLIQITHPDGTTTTTFTFDAAGRKTGLTDPDRGAESYTYDQNGNLIQTSDPRGAAGTVYAGYDGLNRPIWRNTANSPVGAYATRTYDSTANGSFGVGRISSETFAGSGNSSLSGAYNYTYDARGRTSGSTTTIGGVGVCPTGWTCADIGAPALAGSQSYVGDGVWTVQGAGGDIWGTSDQFHYVYQTQPGDGSVSAQVASQSLTDQWAKAGVMLRLSNAANAPYYAVEVTPGNGISVQYRSTAGGSAAIAASTSGRAPAYVQVTRTGTSFTAYTSNDGSTWTAITGSTVSIPALTGTLLAGMAVTSHNTSALGTATFAANSPSPPTPSSVTSYATSATYNDADQQLTQTYPTGEVVTTGYTAQGWLTSLTQAQGGTTTNLLENASYSGAAGAAGLMTSAQLGGGTYTYSATYDILLHATELKTTLTSSGAVLFQQNPAYDAVGNVTGATTTLSTGTDAQQFCYDEQNRLVWAGAIGTPSCSGTAIAPGTLTNAEYTQTFAYDTLDRLTSGPAGTYTYGDQSHLHAATSVGAAWTASYDAAGDMTCRAPDASSTCAGPSPTGQQLSYNNEGWLTAWQNAPTSPSSTAQYLYDASGERVMQQVTNSGTTTTTVYVGGLEEVATTGATTTTTTYYYAEGKRIALAVNGAISYLVTDTLGSSNVTLDATGAVTASALYAPYGTARYSSGTMPTSYGFTGQRADGATGLDYYGARYYDPVVGQFTSADTVMDGLNRYGYVHGNPSTHTDPTGHFISCVQMFQGTVADQLGALMGCASDMTVGLGQALAEGYHGMGVYNKLILRRNSGTYAYLSSRGVQAAKAATRPGTVFKQMLSNFDPRGGQSAADYAYETATSILSDAKNLRPDARAGAGTRASRAVANLLESTLPKTKATLKVIGKVGKIAAVAGAVLTGAVAGWDYYDSHRSDPHAIAKSVGVGVLHAGLTYAGAWAFGAAGAAIGGLCGPAAFVCSPALAFAGGALGGYLGDKAAGWLVDQVDNGNAGRAWNAVTSTASNVWNKATDAWSGLTHAFGL